MIKRLISFFLIFVFLVALPLSAAYRYNPYTRKLDYYEAAGDIVLGDIGDITLTGLATGNILYYDGAAWVNLATGANTEFLTLAAGIPAWAAIPAGVVTFVGLNDTPVAYAGTGLYPVRVNAAMTALEFVDTLSLNNALATGEIGLDLYSINATFSTIAQSDAEGIALSSDLRIGVDETLRSIIIADRGDIATDFGHTAAAQPAIWLYNAAATTRTLIYDGNFTTSGNSLNFTSQGILDIGARAITTITLNADIAVGDAFLIGTWDDGSELTDDDAEQAFVKIFGEINQTNTAWYVGLLVDMKETSIGGGVNELMALRRGGVDQFTIDRTGAVTTGSWAATAIASAYIGAHAGTHAGVGADSVDHDTLTNYAANQHVVLPGTIANVLSDHTLLAHTTLGLFDASADVDHNATTNYAANQHVVLPNTIANVLTDHNLAAHTALGLFDASGDVDHNLTTNYAANQHVVLPNTIANVLSDHNVGAHTATIGGTGVNSSGWTDYVYVTTGVWAVDATLGKVANGIAITGAVASTVTITNDNTDGQILSSTANLILASTGGAATIEITGDLLPSADVTYDLGNNTLAWQDIVQTSTGTQYLGDTNVNGTWQTVRSGAMLSFQLREAGAYVEKASLGSTTAFSMNAALDHITITQSAVAGTATQPLIFIDDARTGVTADTIGEATIVIDAEGAFALYIEDGSSWFATTVTFGAQVTHNHNLAMTDTVNIGFGAGTDIYSLWDTNGAGDDLFAIITANMVQANETAAIWYGVLNPNGMTDHDNYLSPTFILANDEGADANDYAGVAIGERTQADVKVAHYFDFYAMTGSSDGAVDPSNAELAAIFRFGPNGTGVPDNATTPGDVLFEGSIEIDGNINLDGELFQGTYIVSQVVNFDDGGPVAIATVGDGYVVTDVYIEVTTTWDGNGTIVIGDGGTADGFLTDAGITQGATAYYGQVHSARGAYLFAAGEEVDKIYTGADTVDATLVAGTSTQGIATVYVHVTRLK